MPEHNTPDQRNAAQMLLEHPRKVFQAVLAVLLATAFIVILLSWIVGVHDLTPLLVLFGVAAVMLMVSDTQKGLPLTAAVLIVGTVVGGEQFILALTSLMTGNESATARAIYGSNGATAASSGVDHEQLARLIVAAIDQSSPADAEAATTKILDRADVATLAEMIQVDDADVPLMSLSERVAWEEFVAEWEDANYFQNDMTLLQQQGLVGFPGTNYLAAQITPRGQDVLDFIRQREEDFMAIEPSSVATLVDDIDLANDPSIVPITEGQPIQDELTLRRPVHWYRLTVNERSSFVIETRRRAASDRTDTELALFRGADNPDSPIAENDDLGDDIYSRIVTGPLSPRDTYFIRVTGFLNDTGGYELHVDEQ